MHVIILDVGTSSMASSVYSDAGKCLFTASKEYSTEFIYPSMVEQDPLIWRNAAFEVLSKTAAFASQKDLDISAIAVTSQRASLIAVDKDGEPMRKAIMWQDKRTASECEEMEKHISMRELYLKTGLRLSPYAVLPRIIWLRENERDTFNKAYKLMGVQDFVIHSLTGQYKTDWTQAARTMLMDITKFSWDDDLLNIAHLNKDKLCELVPPGSVAGGLTEYAANQTGLKSGLPVIICGGDQQNAAVGLNVIKPGVAEANTGTGSFIIAHAEKPVFDDDCRLICSASAIKG
ncbi:MAG: carbohydrate kinase, partial [Eubacteriaceae bacterium]|nr:carbohydrate kinase [Eubacteriaceae bacterium]